MWNLIGNLEDRFSHEGARILFTDIDYDKLAQGSRGMTGKKYTLKFLNFWTPENCNCCNLPKIQEKRSNLMVFRQKEVNGIANSEDSDQTAPLGAVRSGSALFAQTYLSENFGSLG